MKVFKSFLLSCKTKFELFLMCYNDKISIWFWICGTFSVSNIKKNTIHCLSSVWRSFYHSGIMIKIFKDLNFSALKIKKLCDFRRLLDIVEFKEQISYFKQIVKDTKSLNVFMGEYLKWIGISMRDEIFKWGN